MDGEIKFMNRFAENRTIYRSVCCFLSVYEQLIVLAKKIMLFYDYPIVLFCLMKFSVVLVVPYFSTQTTHTSRLPPLVLELPT